MSRSQIARNRSVPLAKCSRYRAACDWRGSSFRRSFFRSRRGPQVAAIQPEQIERIEGEWSMPPHQLIEQRLAVRSWAHDLSVQDGGAAREILSYRSGQRL